jgi:hypothetical protein
MTEVRRLVPRGVATLFAIQQLRLELWRGLYLHDHGYFLITLYCEADILFAPALAPCRHLAYHEIVSPPRRRVIPFPLPRVFPENTLLPAKCWH